MSGLLVPVLQAYDWPHVKQVVHQPLVNGASKWMPWLTFADDEPHTRSIRTVGDAEALRGASVSSLETMNYEINVLPPSADGPPFAIAVLEGGEYASEQVLSETAMRVVAERLGCSNLVVGIPHRGIVVAIDMDLPQQQVGRFLTILSAQYFNARSQPLSPLGLLVMAGVVCGEVSGMEESGRGFAQAEDFIATDVSMELRGATVVVRAAGSDFKAVTNALTPMLFRQLVNRGPGEVDVEIEWVHIELSEADADGYGGVLRQAVLKVPGTRATIGAVRMVGPNGPVGGRLEGIDNAVVQALGRAPGAVFILVAGADGKVESSEYDALVSGLERSLDSLVEAGMLANQEELIDTVRYLFDNPSEVAGTLVLVRTLLGTSPHAEQTVRWLMNLGVRLASVHSDGPVRELGDLRDDELGGLRQVASLLGVKL